MMYSDPGSQLVGASGNMESWFSNMKSDLEHFVGNTSFSWEINPANGPWRQGRAEVRIKVLKKLITVSVGSCRLTPTELQTVLFEVSNLSNERPIGINKTPKADGAFKVLTPNCLLMGRSLNSVPDDSELANHMKKSDRYQLISQVTSEFWDRWSQEVTPEAVIRQRWHETGRNLQVGDVVLLHDKSELKGKYLLGIVEETRISQDGLVRSCLVGYTIPYSKDPVGRYSGGRRVRVSRSIQRLTLLLPIEEQSSKLVVEDNVVREETQSK